MLFFELILGVVLVIWLYIGSRLYQLVTCCFQDDLLNRKGFATWVFILTVLAPPILIIIILPVIIFYFLSYLYFKMCS